MKSKRSIVETLNLEMEARMRNGIDESVSIDQRLPGARAIAIDPPPLIAVRSN